MNLIYKKDLLMRRNGFTMVELIFVIIIIGILSVAAIPKFGDIKDRAKINSEYSSLSGIQSAITAKIEFTMEDTGNIQVNWHNTTEVTDAATTYQAINDNKKVLKSIIKKGDDLHIVAYYDAGTNIDGSGTDGYDDILVIKGAASNAQTGVTKSTDIEGKPDKNDFWIFNGSSDTINVYHYNNGAKTTILESGTLALIDNDAQVALTNTVNSSTDATSGQFNITEDDGTTNISLTMAKHTVGSTATAYTY
jgi:prepilin-type N-terminal cleavage/methylation domain-containing protein